MHLHVIKTRVPSLIIYGEISIIEDDKKEYYSVSGLDQAKISAAYVGLITALLYAMNENNKKRFVDIFMLINNIWHQIFYCQLDEFSLFNSILSFCHTVKLHAN